MIQIPIAPWETKSFSIKSCKSVRLSLQTFFQMWNETLSRLRS